MMNNANQSGRDLHAKDGSVREAIGADGASKSLHPELLGAVAGEPGAVRAISASQELYDEEDEHGAISVMRSRPSLVKGRRAMAVGGGAIEPRMLRTASDGKRADHLGSAAVSTRGGVRDGSGMSLVWGMAECLRSDGFSGVDPPLEPPRGLLVGSVGLVEGGLEDAVSIAKHLTVSLYKRGVDVSWDLSHSRGLVCAALPSGHARMVVYLYRSRTSEGGLVGEVRLDRGDRSVYEAVARCVHTCMGAGGGGEEEMAVAVDPAWLGRASSEPAGLHPLSLLADLVPRAIPRSSFLRSEPLKQSTTTTSSPTSSAVEDKDVWVRLAPVLDVLQSCTVRSHDILTAAARLAAVVSSSADVARVLSVSSSGSGSGGEEKPPVVLAASFLNETLATHKVRLARVLSSLKTSSSSSSSSQKDDDDDDLFGAMLDEEIFSDPYALALLPSPTLSAVSSFLSSRRKQHAEEDEGIRVEDIVPDDIAQTVGLSATDCALSVSLCTVLSASFSASPAATLSAITSAGILDSLVSSLLLHARHTPRAAVPEQASFRRAVLDTLVPLAAQGVLSKESTATLVQDTVQECTSSSKDPVAAFTAAKIAHHLKDATLRDNALALYDESFPHLQSSNILKKPKTPGHHFTNY